jgi:hypothetical protein
MIRLSTRANRDRKNFTPKDTRTKRNFHGVSRHLHPFKAPTKADAGKPSPRSIGLDADENGESRQATHQIKIIPVVPREPFTSKIREILLQTQQPTRNGFGAAHHTMPSDRVGGDK